MTCLHTRALGASGLLVGLLATSTAQAAPTWFDEDAGHPLHLRLDTAATWGIGGQMFVGAHVHGVGEVGVWQTRSAVGTFDVGLAGSYDHEGTFLAPWIDPTTTTGATHRAMLLGTIGTTFHMGPHRRVGLGLHVVGGWCHWQSAYRVHGVGFDGADTVAEDLPVVGGQLSLTYRITRVVGLDLIAMVPVPTAPTPAISWGHLGVGLSFMLR